MGGGERRERGRGGMLRYLQEPERRWAEDVCYYIYVIVFLRSS